MVKEEIKQKCKFDELMDCELPKWRGGCTKFKLNDCIRMGKENSKGE